MLSSPFEILHNCTYLVFLSASYFVRYHAILSVYLFKKIKIIRYELAAFYKTIAADHFWIFLMLKDFWLCSHNSGFIQLRAEYDL